MRYSVTVEQRGKFWQARVYFEGELGNSVRFSTGVAVGEDEDKSKRLATTAAFERAEQLEKERALNSRVAKSNRDSLEEIAKRMLAQKQTDKRRPRAIDALVFNLDKHVMPFFGGQRDVRTMKRRDVEEFKIKLAKTYAPTSVNNALTAIRQVLKYACYVDETIEAVPVVANIPVDPYGTGMPITREQATEFLASFKEDEVDEREFNQFLLGTGLRKTESLAIRWDWIDWDERVIKIPGEVRKGGKKQRVPTTITPEVYALLRSRQKRERQPQKNRVWFQFKNGGRRRPGARDYDLARRAAAEKAGIAGYRHHDSRHTRATMLADNGATEMDLRDSMNWETTAMANRYTHPSQDRVRKFAVKVQISSDPSRSNPSRSRKKRAPPTAT